MSALSFRVVFVIQNFFLHTPRPFCHLDDRKDDKVAPK